MHNIRFVNLAGYKYLVEIDGVRIALSSAMNRIPKGDVDGLRSYIEKLEEKVKSGESLAELRPIMNGTNMLRILDALFHEQTIHNWEAVLDRNPERSGRDSFNDYFGYIHNVPNCPSSFAEELYAIASEHWQAHNREIRQKLKEAEVEDRIRKSNYDRHVEFASKVSALELQNRALVEEWIVERKRIVSNVLTYSVNGIEINICLSGRPEFGDAFYVASFLSDMKNSLSENDSEKLISLVRKSGGKAALEIMQKLFHDEAKIFMVEQQRRSVLNKRISPSPSKLMKEFSFANSYLSHPFGVELLEALESDMPTLEKALVKTSDDEIRSNNSSWRLFYVHADHLTRIEIVFPNKYPLNSQMRQYYQHIVEPYINSKMPYAQQLYKVHLAITRLLQYVDNSEATSILDLSMWDFASAVSKMVQQDNYSLSTIRNSLILTKCFITYVAPEMRDRIIPAKIIPPPVLNPTPPLDPIVFVQVKQYKDCLPKHIWLAFRTYEETGSRSTSIVYLTSDCLVRIEDRWALRVYNHKEAGKNALSGIPNTVTHWLSKELGEELHAYILETENLRSQLEFPYIFVYETKTFRKGSSRRPMVLTASIYNDFLSRLCKEKGIVNREGFVQTPSSRSIRAEVGRSMFARGETADAVSRKLNNTAPVAALHYDTMYPKDEAEKRRLLYAETLDPKFGVSEIIDEKVVYLNTPMYGRCNHSEKCGNCNDCSSCSERIVERCEGG